jgi:hypothetical protein
MKETPIATEANTTSIVKLISFLDSNGRRTCGDSEAMQPGLFSIFGVCVRMAPSTERRISISNP